MTVPHNAEQMGTGPNSPLEPRRTLVLGTSPMARELAQAYQRLGNETQTGTVSQAREFRPQLIATTGDSPDTLAEVAAVAEETGAEVAPSVSACHHTADRLAVRKQASEELGLPTLEYEFASTPQEMQDAVERIGYPCVVKAPTSNDGEGFSFVRSSGDLAVAWSNADRGVGQGAVVERFIDFDFECTILAARSIDPNTGELATWFCEPIGTRHREGRLVAAPGCALSPSVRVGADREGVQALDAVDQPGLPQRVERAVDGLRPAQAGRFEPRQDLVGGQRLAGGRAQHAENEVLVARPPGLHGSSTIAAAACLPEVSDGRIAAQRA